jgi:hypothetical protein
VKKPETKFGDKVDRYLQAKGGTWLNVHGGPMQKSGWPDRIGCYKGRFIGIELKTPGKVPTRLQRKRLRDIARNGGFSTSCKTMDGVKKFFTAVDEILENEVDKLLQV